MRRMTCFTAALCFVVSFAATAAIPPLSQADREDFATDIVEGHVVSLKKEEKIQRDDYSDYIYKAKIIITAIGKGELEPGNPVTFSFWKAGKRPSGWTGRTGQYGIIKHYSNIRVYLTKNVDGTFELIEPNGFDHLEE